MTGARGQRWARAALLAGLVAVAGVVAACGDDDDGAPSASTADARSELRGGAARVDRRGRAGGRGGGDGQRPGHRREPDVLRVGRRRRPLRGGRRRASRGRLRARRARPLGTHRRVRRGAARLVRAAARGAVRDRAAARVAAGDGRRAAGAGPAPRRRAGRRRASAPRSSRRGLQETTSPAGTPLLAAGEEGQVDLESPFAQLGVLTALNRVALRDDDLAGSGTGGGVDGVLGGSPSLLDDPAHGAIARCLGDALVAIVSGEEDGARGERRAAPGRRRGGGRGRRPGQRRVLGGRRRGRRRARAGAPHRRRPRDRRPRDERARRRAGRERDGHRRARRATSPWRAPSCS